MRQHRPGARLPGCREVRCGASSSPVSAWSRRSAAASRRPGRGSSPARAVPSRIDRFEVDRSRLPRSPARCRAATASDGTFNADQWMEPKEQRKVDDFIVYAMAAATQALDDAGWQPDDAGGPERHRRADRLRHRRPAAASRRPRSRCTSKGPRRISPVLHSRPPDQPRLRPRLDPPRPQGPEPRRGHRLLDRRACDRRRRAADRARRCRRDGGGRHRSADLPARARRLRRLPGAVDRLQRRPERASRPYDKDRDGFVMGEGAGVVVLEEYEHAKARGAKIYAEVIGYGLSGDAYHITAPAEDGDGAYPLHAGGAQARRHRRRRHRLHQRARHLDAAGRRDRAAARSSGWSAMPRRSSSMSSTKSAIGHLLGAAGAVEAIFSVLAIRDRIVAADAQPRQSRRSRRRSTSCRTRPRSATIDIVLSNSFGFGGTNASLVLATASREAGLRSFRHNSAIMRGAHVLAIGTRASWRMTGIEPAEPARSRPSVRSALRGLAPRRSSRSRGRRRSAARSRARNPFVAVLGHGVHLARPAGGRSSSAPALYFGSRAVRGAGAAAPTRSRS